MQLDQSADFPVKMTLTSEGLTYFIQSRLPFEKMVLADGTVEHGVRWNTFSPALLQQFLLKDCISRIELARTEFNSRKSEVINLVKLIVYGMLYKQMDLEFYKSLIESEAVKKWNRMHTSHILDEQSRFKKQYQEKVALNKPGQLELKKMILTPILSRINGNGELGKEEKARMIRTADKFLSNLNCASWYVLMEFNKQDTGYLDLLVTLRDLLSRYLDKTTTAGNLAITLMALLGDAEKRNITQFVKKHFGDKKNIDQLLYNEASRTKVFNGMEAARAYLYLAWKISPGDPGQRSKLQVSLYNKESEYREINQLLEENRMMDTRKISLVDFYSETEEDSEMGLHYLSFLSEACGKVDIRFDSIVNQIKDRDLTVITLTMLI